MTARKATAKAKAKAMVAGVSEWRLAGSIRLR